MKLENAWEQEPKPKQHVEKNAEKSIRHPAYWRSQESPLRHEESPPAMKTHVRLAALVEKGEIR